MKYLTVAEVYEKIESTAKRLEMTDLLVDLLRKTPKEIIDKVVYLTQGKLYPDFVGVEIGVAEKLALKAVSRSSGLSEKEIEGDLRKTGDLGLTAERFLGRKIQRTFFQEPLTVLKVYSVFNKMAEAAGSGSVEQKISLLAGLLSNAIPKEARYLIRMVTGKLRLGVADMTVLDALAIAYCGEKEARSHIERAYNITSDLGRVSKAVAEEGLKGVEGFKVQVGVPIRPMLAERLGSLEEVLEKLGGRCMAEFKYDGERVQAHKKGSEVTLFSRRLENITGQYPDAVRMFKTNVKAEEAILEAECVAVDPDTGEMRPFQELMHRRRKHAVQQAAEEYPIALFVFDVLYADGLDYTLKPYLERHKALEAFLIQEGQLRIAEYLLAKTLEELERFFESAVEHGSEGLICKSTAQNSVYQAGARGWQWIKYKRDYKSEMTDTVDLAVVGGFHGRGRRAGTYGALLLAAYDSEGNQFKTVCKCGSGFTDEDLAKIPEIMRKHRIPQKPTRVDSTVESDVWFEPNIVLEVKGAEITLSPIHTCALDKIREGSGLAIRFPRFTGKYRLDKSVEDSTTEQEIIRMYEAQLRKMPS